MTLLYIPSIHCGKRCCVRIQEALEAGGYGKHVISPIHKVIDVPEKDVENISSLLAGMNYATSTEPPNLQIGIYKSLCGLLFYALYLLASPQYAQAMTIAGTFTTVWIGWDIFKAARTGMNMDTLFTLSSLLALSAAYFHYCHLGHAVLILTLRIIGILTKDFTAQQLSRANHPTEHNRAVATQANDQEINIENITSGTRLKIKIGERIPVDGILKSRVARVNRSAWTGQDTDDEKALGAPVTQGWVANTELLVEATETAAASSQVQTMKAVMTNHQSSDNFITGIEPYLVWFILGIALIASTWALLTLSPLIAFNTLMTTLVACCPCGLALAQPLFDSVTMLKLKAYGLHVHSSKALAAFRHAKQAKFDLNGTLTRPVVLEAKAFGCPTKLLQIATALEQDAQHPTAQAILKYIRQQPGDIVPSELGPIKILRNGRYSQRYYIGDNYMMPELTEQHHDFITTSRAQGLKVIFIAENTGDTEQKILGYFLIKNQLDPGTNFLFAGLKILGINIEILTGSTEEQAKAFTQRLDGHYYTLKTDYHPKTHPKEAEIDSAAHDQTLYVGDGFNDHNAIKKASCGIMRGRGDIATERDMTFYSDSIKNLLPALKITKTAEVLKNIVLIACGLYVLFSLSWAAGLILPFGYVLSPTCGALMMAAETLSIAGSAGLWWLWPTAAPEPVIWPEAIAPADLSLPQRTELVAVAPPFEIPTTGEPAPEQLCCHGH